MTPPATGGGFPFCARFLVTIVDGVKSEPRQCERRIAPGSLFCAAHTVGPLDSTWSDDDTT